MKQLGTISFVDVREAPAGDLEKVREMRNHPDIRKYMYTDHVISAEEHAQWLQSLREGAPAQYFVVYKAGIPVGVVYLTGISARHRSADWGFYLDPARQGGSTGVLIEYALLEYAFNKLKLEKLNAEVLSTNPAVVQLHRKFGFKDEGIRRANILKGGQRIDVYLLGITPLEWAESRGRFEKLVSKFSAET